MQDETENVARLLDAFRGELESLLCGDELSDEEKVARMRRAQLIIEQGVLSNG